jgi:molybdate transport system substrate-binding protein
LLQQKIPRILDCIIMGLAAGFALFAGSAWAGEVTVAVAANFAEAAREIGALFERSTGYKAVFSFASTGTLYTQITQDAPFAVFLAADQTHPELAIDEGFAVTGSQFTYATGKIVLFSRDRSLVKGEATLKDGSFTRIAIANPVTAPYGAAAIAVLKKLGVYAAVEPRIVQGNNIAQTYQFVETGNAELGFVALSQIVRKTDGSRWLVPEDLYPKIAQDAVLLKRGADSPAARALLDFLKGPEAANVITKFGYGTGN